MFYRPEMKDEGLDKNYADINKFLDKPLVPYKNFLRKHISQSFHPILFTLHKANKTVGEEVTNKVIIFNLTSRVAHQERLLY